LANGWLVGCKMMSGDWVGRVRRRRSSNKFGLGVIAEVRFWAQGKVRFCVLNNYGKSTSFCWRVVIQTVEIWFVKRMIIHLYC
jgi:hypothetical protein